jgi:hypothetical protein
MAQRLTGREIRDPWRPPAGRGADPQVVVHAQRRRDRRSRDGRETTVQRLGAHDGRLTIGHRPDGLLPRRVGLPDRDRGGDDAQGVGWDRRPAGTGGRGTSTAVAAGPAATPERSTFAHDRRGAQADDQRPLARSRTLAAPYRLIADMLRSTASRVRADRVNAEMRPRVELPRRHRWTISSGT